MKNTILTTLLLVMAGCLQAQNLIKNGTYDAPLTRETRLRNNAGHAILKTFTEDTTWNKAARATVTHIYVSKKNNYRSFLTWVYIGGDGKDINSTFPLEQNCSYRFSLKLKTNIRPEQANILCRVGNFGKDGKHEKRLAQTPILKNLNEKTWTNISGTFHSGKETAALLWIPIYASTQHGEKMCVDVGQWLMIDDVVIEKIQQLPEVSSAQSEKKKTSVKAVYESGKSYGNFRTLKTNSKPDAETVVRVTAEKTAFHVTMKCSEPDAEKIRENKSFSDKNNPWKDVDLVEFFFLPPGAQTPVQFAVSVNGAEWTSITDKNISSSWNAAVTRERNSWSVSAKIPYKLLGYSKMPEEIGFFAARERNHAKEFSSLLFQKSSFHDVRHYGVLIPGSIELWAKNKINELTAQNKKLRNKSYTKQINQIKYQTPQQIYADIQSLKHKIHISILEESKVIVSMPPLGADFHLPYIPQQFLADQDSIYLRAAGNELLPVPLVISNLSDKTEDFRVTIEHLDHNKCECYGLLGKDKQVLGKGNIELFRAIRIRDSELKDSREFFDSLVSLGDASTITIPARDSALIWLRIKTHGKQPGKYTGIFRINPLSAVNPKADIGNTLKAADAVQTKTFPVTLEILPFALDSKPVLPLNGFSNPVYSKNCLPVLEEIGFNVFMRSPHMLRAEFDEKGHITKFWVHPNQLPVLQLTTSLLKDKIKKKECSFLIGYGSYHTFYHVILKKKFPEHSPEWRTAWSEWIGAFDKVLTQYGITKDLYTHELHDEPKAKEVGHAMKAIAQIIKQDHPGIRTAVTVTPYISLCQGLIDSAPFVDEFIIYVSTSLADYKTKGIDYIAELKKAGAKMGLYKCNTDNGTPAYSYYRCYPWHILSENLCSLNLYTAITGYYKGGHDWRVMPGGNWFVRSFDTLVRTVRSDTLLAGLNDVKYMLLLKKLAEKSADKKLAGECMEFYQKTLQEVLLNSHNPEFIPAVRTKITDYIIKLNQAEIKK